MTGKDILLFVSAGGGVVLLVAGWVVVGYIDRLQSRTGALASRSREAEQVLPTVEAIGVKVERLECRVAVTHWVLAFLLGGVAVLTWRALRPMGCVHSKHVRFHEPPR